MLHVFVACLGLVEDYIIVFSFERKMIGGYSGYLVHYVNIVFV